MISLNDRHRAFIEEMRNGIKKFEANVTANCDKPTDATRDELMEEIEKKFDELFGIGSD